MPYDEELARFQLEKAAERAESAVPVVESVIFNKGNHGIYLTSGSGVVFQVPQKYTVMFAHFLEQVAHNAPGEPLSLGCLEPMYR